MKELRPFSSSFESTLSFEGYSVLRAFLCTLQKAAVEKARVVAEVSSLFCFPDPFGFMGALRPLMSPSLVPPFTLDVLRPSSFRPHGSASSLHEPLALSFSAPLAFFAPNPFGSWERFVP